MRNQQRLTLVVNKTEARISIIKPKSSPNIFFPQSQSKSLGKSAKTEVCKSRPSPHSCINSPFPCHTLVMESWRFSSVEKLPKKSTRNHKNQAGLLKANENKKNSKHFLNLPFPFHTLLMESWIFQRKNYISKIKL